MFWLGNTNLPAINTEQQLSVTQHYINKTGLAKSIQAFRSWDCFLFPDCPISEVCLHGDKASTSSVIHFPNEMEIGIRKGGKKNTGEKKKSHLSCLFLSENHAVKQWDQMRYIPDKDLFCSLKAFIVPRVMFYLKKSGVLYFMWSLSLPCPLFYLLRFK